MARPQLVTAVLLCCCFLAGAKGEEDFTEAFNVTLQGIIDKIPDPLRLPITLPTLPLKIPGLADLEVIIHFPIITGHTGMVAEDCTYDESTTLVAMSLVLPALSITCRSLEMKGILLGNIDIDGEGPASFVLDNLRITMRGNTTTNNWEDLDHPVVVFADAELDMVLEQWTVEMEGLTPGSDLGTLMNSFFSGLGPDIFHLLSDIINQTDLVMNILNIFFPPADAVENTSQAWDSEKMNEVFAKDVAQLLSKYFKQ